MGDCDGMSQGDDCVRRVMMAMLAMMLMMEQQREALVTATMIAAQMLGLDGD